MRLIDHTTPPYTARSAGPSQSFGLVARTRPAPDPAQVAGNAAKAPLVLISPALAAEARASRARVLGELGARLVRTIVERGRQALADWRRYRDAQATYLTLRELDSHTLRDLGFHRSELRSVALDVARGDVASDRRIRFDRTPARSPTH
jgi:uncharacterized protein YjiS (DUF1127 family)